MAPCLREIVDFAKDRSLNSISHIRPLTAHSPVILAPGHGVFLVLPKAVTISENRSCFSLSLEIYQ